MNFTNPHPLFATLVYFVVCAVGLVLIFVVLNALHLPAR